MRHTPTPWKIGFNEYDVCNNKAIICECMGLKEGKENAKFIIKAVNNHERLLEVCNELMRSNGENIEELHVLAYKAIKQAESEK